MAAATVTAYPSVDVDVSRRSSTESSPQYTLNVDRDSAEDSSEFGEESDVNEAVQEHQVRLEAQRDAFAQYLKTVDPSLLLQTKGEEERIVHTQKDGGKKIIDEVRRYQQELFERALEENVIAVLDTGSGKTLIACLLIRHILMEEVINRGRGKPHRVVFFLANSVHLVQQQARVLANNLTTKPFIFIGEERAEVWKTAATWLDVVEKNTPIVCTPAVLCQCLDAALIRIDQISLLVFDEAHHAKKDHPYSRIVRSHYLKCTVELRPRIFGMTASPVDSKGNIDTGVTDLEELLHCKIVTTDDPSKLSFVPKPTNVVWKHPRFSAQPDTELCRILSDKVKQCCDARRGLVFAKTAVTTLGPWCADRVWKYIIAASEHGRARIIKRFEQSQEYAAMESIEERDTAMANLHQAVMLVLENEYKMPTPNTSHLSSKVLLLYTEILKIYNDRPETRAIVFVDQRLTAEVLNDCFTMLKLPLVRTSVLLGTARDSLSLKRQGEFLDQFRAGLVNLIFATSVADEGIDIPQCNLCVRFDLYKSPIQYIQSRGRARMKDSVYVHMIEDGNLDQENEFHYAINCDKYITEYCQRLDPGRLLGRGTKLEHMIARDSSKRSFKTAKGAVCDYDNAMLILSRFVSSLRYMGALGRESYAEEIDEANNLFRYLVRLPTLAKVNLSGARGEWRPNKQLAKRSAAWSCCFLLRKKELLDDGLNSPFRKVKPENLNARLAVTEKKSAYPMLTKPSLWQRGLGQLPAELHVSMIHLKPQKTLRRDHPSIVLLTRTALPELPSFEIFVDDAVQTDVKIRNINQVLRPSLDDINTLTTFTLDGVFRDVFNKTYQTDATSLSYWLAPLSPSYADNSFKLEEIIDMEAVNMVKQGRIKWSPGGQTEDIWTQKFLCDPRNGKFHYFTGDIMPSLNIFDPVPDTVPPIPQKSRTNIIDFSDSYWKASKRNYIQSTYDQNQKVISAELSTTRRNFLEPGSEKECAQIMCFIAPQPLEVSRLHPQFAASCLVWPAIIHRVEAYLISLEAFDKLELHGVPADLALEAFTKDSDEQDHQNQTHIGGRHGMGKNYERLEFIGDSLLKMMTTITVFNRTNCDEEGMHCRRMEILCNRHLYNVSTEKYHLYQYARTSGFNRETWYPENLVLLKGRGVKKVPEPVKHARSSQDLGMKTVADISEAIIGAAVMSSRNSPRQFDLGIKAITKLVDSEDHDIISWSEIAQMYEAPEWSLKTNDIQANKLAEDIAAKTGYCFNHPRLLRSAFTHSSDTNATVPDLQRLEFLGDAVLDWVSISWLFDTNPDRSPQWLTEHKMAMVSNKFLAALAVVLDFDKFIYCSTAKLYADISIFSKHIRDEYANRDVNRDFWTHIDSPPKALSDLVESYIGAVLVDSGFDYAEIEKFFHKHVVWFFEDISKYDSFANRHPTTYLYKKVTEEFKCRDFNVISANTDEGVVEAKVTAGVLIHNKVIADASGASAKYAKVRASQKALTKLRDVGIEKFRTTFGCDCNIRDD